MNIEFEKLRNVCSEILPIDPHIFCSHKEKKMEECTEENCPLKANDVSVVMANDAVRNMHIVTDNTETLKNALARIAMLEKKIKSYYCNDNDVILLKAQAEIRRLEADLRDAVSLLVRVDFPSMREEDEEVWENDRIEFLKRMEVR